MTGMGRGAASAVTGWLHVHGSGGPGHGRGRGREPDQGLAGRDRGLATVWVAMTMATLCVVFAVVLALGKVVAVRHLVEAARRTWRLWPRPTGPCKGPRKHAGRPRKWPRHRGPWWSGAWCEERSPM